PTAFNGRAPGDVWSSSVSALPPLASFVRLAYSPGGDRVLAAVNLQAAATGEVHVWAQQGGRLEKGVLRHNTPLLQAAFTPDGRGVFTVAEGGVARLWDAATGKPAGLPFRHPSAVNHAALSPDGRWALAATFDHSLWLWDLTPRPDAVLGLAESA